MENFLRRIMSKMTFKPRSGCVDGYLYDLDGSERVTRPRTGMDIFPTQENATVFQKLGVINSVLPLMDGFVWAQAYAKTPYGPIMSEIPDNLQWQITIPGMSKYQPQS